ILIGCATTTVGRGCVTPFPARRAGAMLGHGRDRERPAGRVPTVPAAHAAPGGDRGGARGPRGRAVARAGRIPDLPRLRVERPARPGGAQIDPSASSRRPLYRRPRGPRRLTHAPRPGEVGLAPL